MTNFNDISQIETWLKGEMSAADRRAFEAQLASDKALQQEVETFRQLFDGFQGLKEERFAATVNGWADEIKQSNRGAGSNGQIVPINRGAAHRRILQRLAVAAGFILLLGMAAAWWASQRYSDVRLASGAYSPPLASGTMGGQTPQADNVEKAFELGHQFFQKRNYADAAHQFDSVVLAVEANPETFDSLTRRFYLENAKWSRLLSQFAAGQLADEEFSAALDAFANDPASEYAEKAKKLQRDLGSVWRKIKN